MSILTAIFLGLVQGIAEFLPISSSGHLSVFQNLLNLDTGTEGHVFFDVLLHLGTLVSVCVVYWKDIAEMIREVFSFFVHIRHPVPGSEKTHPARRLVLMIIIAILPLFLILPVNGYIEQLYYNTFFIGIAFLLTGLILFISDRMVIGRKNEKTMTVGNALFVGACQALATIPGLSRSGTTITGGIAAGLDRNFAVKFSFLISIPAILGANILSLIDAIKGGIDTELLPVYLVGMLVAMVSGYFAIRLLRYIASKGKFGKFAYYCWFAGVVTIIASFF